MCFWDLFPVCFGFFLELLSWNWQYRFASAVFFSTSSASRVGFVRLGLEWVQGSPRVAFLGHVWGWLRLRYWDGLVVYGGGLVYGGFRAGLG